MLIINMQAKGGAFLYCHLIKYLQCTRICNCDQLTILLDRIFYWNPIITVSSRFNTQIQTQCICTLAFMKQNCSLKGLVTSAREQEKWICQMSCPSLFSLCGEWNGMAGFHLRYIWKSQLLTAHLNSAFLIVRTNMPCDQGMMQSISKKLRYSFFCPVLYAVHSFQMRSNQWPAISQRLHGTRYKSLFFLDTLGFAHLLGFLHSLIFLPSILDPLSCPLSLSLSFSCMNDFWTASTNGNRAVQSSLGIVGV